MVDRRAQFHQSRLGEHVVAANPAVDRWVDYYTQLRMVRGGVTRWMAEQQGFGMLQQMIVRQYRFFAYMDVFVIYGFLALIALPFIFLMRKSVAKDGVAPE